MEPLKNQWGSVKPYTRHSSSCETPDLDTCSCPKWLYVNFRGGDRVRYALGTPSWAEALELATDKLNELNPEIANAREAAKVEETKLVTVPDAFQMWYDRTTAKLGTGTSTINQYRSIFGW